MSLMGLGLIFSSLLVTLVAGIVMAFAIVVMPGIRSLNDHDFLQAFKVMDRVIQENHPVFMLIWMGSIVALVLLAGLSLFQSEGLNRYFLVGGCAIYILGVMLPTVRINVPLNNELQKQELTAWSESELRVFRQRFEPIWNRWNIIRTIVATITAVCLLAVLVRI